MIIEHALLPVKSGRETDFEAAFALAEPILAAMPGCHGVSLSRCLERRGVYLLLVRWETVEHHTEGFRGSPQYQRWRELLHEFYEPFPVVEHFAPVPLS